MRKTVFLTGSRGFTGSHLLKALEPDFDIYCARRNELPKHNPDYIIHLAAVTTLSSEFTPELFESNIVYAHNIMQYSGRIIYASSTSASDLSNPYAYTKRYIEYLGANHPNATGLRFFNVYGPGNNKGIVKKAIECAKSGTPLDLYGGGNIRDFIYIDDAVRAVIDNLDSKQKLIDVGTGHGQLVYTAVKTIKSVFGEFPIKFMDDVKEDMKFSVAQPGIHGCLTFEQGLERMLCDS